MQSRGHPDGLGATRAVDLDALVLRRGGLLGLVGGAACGERRVLSRSTLQAYVATDYVVQSEPEPIVLRLGEPNASLQALHCAQGVCESVFVTACNPFGRRVADAVNEAAMVALRRHLSAEGYCSLVGLGQGDDGIWPAEPSLLVPGGDAALALDLCVRFEQNATVYTGPDGIPLIVLHPELGLDDGC